MGTLFDSNEYRLEDSFQRGAIRLNSSDVVTYSDELGSDDDDDADDDDDDNDDDDDDVQNAVVRKRRLNLEHEILLNQSYVRDSLLNYAKLTIIGIKGPNYQFNAQNMMHILYPKFIYNMDSDDDWLKQVTVINKLFSFHSDETIQVTKLFKSLISQFEISNHLTFVKNYYPNNYLELLVSPFIKEVTFELIYDENYIPLIKTPSFETVDAKLKLQLKLIVIYLILGISSFNKYLKEHRKSNTNEIQQDLRTSIEIRKIAITLINLHLDEYDTTRFPDDDYEYETTFLLAILLNIQLDTYFSIFENLELLFAIGSHIVNKKLSNGSSPLGIFLSTLFRIVKVFFESTHSIDVHNYSIEGRYKDKGDPSDDDDDEEEEVSIKDSSIKISKSKSTISYDDVSNETQWYTKEPNFNKDNIDPELVYLMYGIPKSLIDMFVEVVLLANDRKIFLSNMKLQKPPPGFYSKCGKLERQIFNWGHPSIPSNATFKQLKTHYNVMLFYNAMIAFYLKIVKRAQWYIYKENVRELYRYFTKLIEIEDPNVKPIFWALLIAGSELPDKKKEIIEYWKRSQKSNYWRARQISYEVWGAREEGDESVDWMDKVREWDVVLCLV
ncbi:uncharacterized protein KQ657_002289 [Scheffersomyces spartinae]|uniref:Uncharacterized protein n=1 Tax=Scheffersomyces spartinae TaxID=45513 RepID=A0A9P8ALB6_9ASCO|nr:uncharacterized protein KQ657_002289 [Scheffersomyces spartinae]KAG7195904.1 hypothetical protein KQ657_002289 [Scheffersomyces spartinae]